MRQQQEEKEEEVAASLGTMHGLVVLAVEAAEEQVRLLPQMLQLPLPQLPLLLVVLLLLWQKCTKQLQMLLWLQ